MLSVAEERELQDEWPEWDPDTREPPPQHDWFVAAVIAQDLGLSFFAYTQLPVEEPFLSIATSWALMRRQALSIAADIQAAARRREAALAR